MSKFFLQLFCDHNTSYSLIIEDDSRVCYAYLMEDENIIGDVWLYNQLASPNETNWNKGQMPFLNPIEFLIDNTLIIPIKHNNEVDCEWDLFSENKFLKEVRLFLRGNLIAKLKQGSKPGWSTIVKIDSPLAKVLL